MKKTLILITFLLISGMATLSAQIYTMRTTMVAATMVDDFGDWEEWSDWEETNLLVKFDISNLRITIYSEEKQVYDIIRSEDAVTDESGDTIYVFQCVDADGVECTVKFMYRESLEDKRSEIYVVYDDLVSWVYQVYSVDE